jgi:hypothetical protein
MFAVLAAATVSAAEVKLPADFVRECESYVGDWATEAEIGGVLYRGKWIANWSPEKCCLDTHWTADTPNGPASGTRVQGWDATAKKVLVVDFGTDGSFSIERYTLTTNQTSKGEVSGADGDGKPFTATAHVVRKDQDFFTWTVTRDGKATENRFRRVKK